MHAMPRYRSAHHTWLALAGLATGLAGCAETVAPEAPEANAQVTMAIPMDTRIVIRLHAVVLSDTRGFRGAARGFRAPDASFTREALRDLVRFELNPIYAQAGIRFEFQPDRGDWTDMRSTLLNDADRSSADWLAEANRVASQFPNKLVVFFRWGGGVSATGNGFGNVPDIGQIFPPGWTRPSVNRRFAVMPNQWGRITQSAVNNRGAGSPAAFFAHEIGHHLGLFHPMPGTQVHEIYGTVNIAALSDAQIQQRLVEFVLFRQSAAALDGDLLADTPPDPGWPIYRVQAGGSCEGIDQVTGEDNTIITLAGASGPYRYNLRLKADRTNVMGYYNSCAPVHTFSERQIARMRETLVHPNRGHLVRALEPNP